MSGRIVASMSAAVDVLSLHPADLAARVPAWELGLAPGGLGIAVIDGAAGEWDAAADPRSAAAAELAAAPVITVGVVRDAQLCPAAAEMVDRCDLVVGPAGATDTVDDRVGQLVQTLTRAGAPALVAAQLLRGGDGRIATESLAYSTLLFSEDFAAWRAAEPAGEPEDGALSRVALEPGAGVWTLRLTRSHRHNAFDARMREELCDALDAIACAGAAPIVLVGDGPSFCSGGDLDEFGTAASPLGAHLVRTGRSVARRLTRVSAQLVAGIHGSCIGAGVELAAFAGTVVTAPDAAFSLPELSMGLNLGAGGTMSIPARIGRHRTLELLLREEPIGAALALEWGLVDEVVEAEALDARCLAVAEKLA